MQSLHFKPLALVLIFCLLPFGLKAQTAESPIMVTTDVTTARTLNAGEFLTITGDGSIAPAGAGVAITAAGNNTITNAGDITGGIGIQLQGTAPDPSGDAQTIRPAYDASAADRDAYYFYHKVTNNTGGTITGAGTGSGIILQAKRAQILNSGTISSTGSWGIYFFAGSGESFVYNTNMITATASQSEAIFASDTDAITIHNDGGTISSTANTAIVLQSLNLIVNSGNITGAIHGISLEGTADDATANALTAPAWDADKATRDGYYYNNTVINEVGGTITGAGTGGHGIHITGKRAQIINHGTIEATGTGHGIYFAAGSGESIVVNSGTISSTSGWGIYAHDNTAGSIVVINGGTISGGAGAIRLSTAGDILVIRNRYTITGNVNFEAGSDELIYVGVASANRIATANLLNLEDTNDSTSTSELGLSLPINTAETTARSLAVGRSLTITGDGSIIVASGVAVTGAGSNTITNSGNIEGTAGTAIALEGTANLNGAPAARPTYDAEDDIRDAYYFHHKVTNNGTGIITGAGVGDGINITGARAQILNIGGTITTAGSRNAIGFEATSGQSFVYNTGSITAATGNPINTAVGADAITIHNDGGTIESTGHTAIVLQGGFNLIVNSGSITGALHGISLQGAADADTITANPNRPAYDAATNAFATAELDAYYFNNKVINETAAATTENPTPDPATITGAGASHGISINGERAQIINHGIIEATGTGHGIFFASTSGESFIYNTGTIQNTGTAGNAILAKAGTDSADAITIHNDGGTIESTGGTAIVLQSLNVLVNSGAITGGAGDSANGSGIDAAGGALQATIDANPNRPAYDSTQTLRDAYYFNNKIINELGGVITGNGTGHGISVAGKRAQIFNHGTIEATGTGHGIYFDESSGESIVINTGTISSTSGWGIYAHDNTAGSIVVINSGTITGSLGAIRLGSADDTLVIREGSNTGDVDFDDGNDELIYFAAETAGRSLAAGEALTIESTGSIIVSSGTAVTGAGDNTITNSGEISSGDDYAIDISADGLTLTNNAGATIEGNEDAIRTQGDVAIVNAGTITAATNGTYRAIYLQGTADADTITANPTAPTYNATGTDLTGKWSGYDAYYFNAKITNEATGIIEATGLATAIDIETERVQIINHGTIEVTDSGDRFTSGTAIAFAPGANQGFVYNTGTIRSFDGNAISTADGVLNGVHTPANNTTEIVIHNDGGTIESTRGTAISISSLSLIVNSGTIDGLTAIIARGVADATMLAAQATRPAYNATGSDRDAYYFNIKILNEATGIIRGNAVAGSRAIILFEKRIQIINHGAITGRSPSRAGTGMVPTIFFSANNDAFAGLQEGSQNFLYNAGSISSLGPDATIFADYNPSTGSFAAAEANEITIHNTGTIEAAASTAIELRSLNVIVNAGDINGGTNANAIELAGIALQATIDAGPATAPAWDASDDDRNAYYFNNTIINELGGIIKATGTGHGINIAGKRAQIFNHGDIIAEGSGHGIHFTATSGESIVVNTGTISSTSGWGIYAHASAGGIVVVNGGIISGGAGAIRISDSDDILVIRNSYTITGNVDFGAGTDELIYVGVEAADRIATTQLSNAPTSSDSTSTSELGVGPTTHTIDTAITDTQALAAGETLIVESAGSVIPAAGIAVTGTGGSNTIINSGTITSNDGIAIQFQSLNTIENSGTITGATHGIHLQGTASQATLDLSPKRPAYDATEALRDAYYFNNKIINETAATTNENPTPTTATITGGGVVGNFSILITGKRAQILNIGGTIEATSAGTGIGFAATSGQSFLYNTGMITTAAGQAIVAVTGADAITIRNSGTISTTSGNDVIELRSLNVIVNSGNITGGGASANGIDLQGTADADTITANPTRPAYDATEALRDAYYFNNKIINETAAATTENPDPDPATITGAGAGNGIRITGKRAQILNIGGTIEATGSSGLGIHFFTGSGQSFVYNTGSISAQSNAIHPAEGIDEITIHNDGGTISSTAGRAIALRSFNLVVNSGTITGASDGINLGGAADATELAAQATRPAYDATEALRDAYYFNNKVINETAAATTENPDPTRATITGATSNHGIRIGGKRAQIHNIGGDIVASGTGNGIHFSAGSGQGFVYNTGNINAAGTTGSAIFAAAATTGNRPLPAADAITIHNAAGGTISSTGSHAIVLESLNVIVNAGAITGGAGDSANGHGINLAGAADATELAANPNRPAYDSTQTLRDAYYFNNKVINNAGGIITGNGTSDGIRILGARAQILNSGSITTEDSGRYGIFFGFNSGQSFVYNTGSITAGARSAVFAATTSTQFADGITIHNTGTMENTRRNAIELNSLNLIVNSGRIIGGAHGIRLAGDALQATIDANPTAPAWDADKATRDAYYFNNTIINEKGGIIRGTDAGSTAGHGISVAGKRAQIFNHGTIEATGTGHGIFFDEDSGESLVVNTGTISSASGWGIYAEDGADSIVVVNGGTITGGEGAIRFGGADDILVIRRGSKITGNVEFGAGTDELIYAGAETSSRLAGNALLNLEATIQFASASKLGVGPPEPEPEPDPTTDPTTPDPVTPDPDPDTTPAPNGGSGGGGSSSSANYTSLFRLSDELILELNANIQDAIYEHNFSFNSEKFASADAADTPENASKEPPYWARGFGSLRTQDASDNNAEASHTLGGVLLGYDLTPEQIKGLNLNPDLDLGFFLGVALGSLSTDDDAELTNQAFFGGAYLELTKDKLFYGFNFTLGFTSHSSERSVRESGNNVKIEGDYSGFFFSPEFILGTRTQIKIANTAPKTTPLSFWERMKAQVNGMDIIPSLRVRYTFASLGEYDEDGNAASRISAEKRSTGTIESRAQVAFPLQVSNQAWKLEPRLGLELRFDLNKSSFAVQNLQTETAIEYEVDKESTLGFFGGLSAQYLRDDIAFKLNVDTIFSGESFILRGQAGLGFQF